MPKDDRKKVLTVGDGDLTLSLALSRAYGDHVDVTASVLEHDKGEFLRVFPDAPLEELDQREVSVLFGVDATQLHSKSADLGTKAKYDNDKTVEDDGTKISKPWDLVSFHHPHLGISNLEESAESTRALLHHRLLCHYLYSAKKISKLVHVCLTGTQPATWKLMEAAKRQNLTLVNTLPDSKPFANVWTTTGEASCDHPSNEEISTSHPQILPLTAKAEPHFAAPRKYRNGKLGRHALARYGYRHRRTEGVLFKGSSKDANVSESTHFVFADKIVSQQQEGDSRNDIGSDTFTETKGRIYVCAICNESFDTECALKLHLSSPVRPKVAPSNGIDGGDQHAHSETESKHDLTVDFTRSPALEPSRDVERNERGDETKGTILIVSSGCDGKRLRWFLQHSEIDNYNFTKRVAQSTIQAGLVLVNGQVALDSSRILKVRDVVTILEAKYEDREGECSPKNTSMATAPKFAPKHPRVEIIERSETSSLAWLVALKPSGMRTKGNFPGTLESIVTQQEGKVYSCISSLETSCSGLCVLIKNESGGKSTLQKGNHCSDGNISVLHTLTVLVHGEPPQDTWFPSRTASLTMEAKWRQKKKNMKRKYGNESLLSKNEEEQSKNTIGRVVPAEIRLKESITIQEKTPSRNAGLSTLQVVTHQPSSSSICHYFRQEGFPVVGDAFCKQEYSKLKRSIRNRIKNKLCLGCFRVEIEILETNNGGEETATATRAVEIPSPNKLSATFWETFLKEDRPAPEHVQ